MKLPGCYLNRTSLHSIAISCSAGLVPHMIETGKVQIASLRPPKTPPAKAPTPATTPQRRAHIAFEDYYTTWRGIATSKSTSDSINPCK